jgi:membrane protease YdiL (CAAX protease family)
MQAIRSLISGHPIGAFVVIAFAFTWTFTFLGSISLAFSLVALFGPAVAAVAVALADGSFADLRSRIGDWRHHLGWYALALAIPFAVAAIARLVLTLSGNAPEGIGSITAVEMVIFVFVIGEEIGWRSFLQPRLRTRLGLGIAGLVTGVIWTIWHLPIYLAPEQGLVAFAAFAAWVVPLGVVIGAFSEATRFSAILATLFHGAANIATPIVLPDVDRPMWLVLGGVIYAVVAIGILLAYNRGAASRRAAGAVVTSRS